MVLENVTNASNGTMDDVPTSDNDPYSITNPSETYRIDSSVLPKPMPIFGALFGINQQAMVQRAQNGLRAAQNTLKRPPTQEEAAALTFWSTKFLVVYSYGAPLGLAGGLYRAWDLRNTFRFPFYKPNLETFNPQVFPPKLGLLTGNRAVLGWHVLRGIVYGYVGKGLGQIFFGGYALSVSEVGIRTDPRLKEYWEKENEKLRGVKDELWKQRTEARGRLPGHSPRRPGQQTQPQQQHVDDASPAGGMYGDGDQSAGYGSSTSSVGMEDDQLREEEGRRKPWTRRPQVQPIPRAQELVEQPFDYFDDASPTAGQGMVDDRAQSKGQRSAWDRIRRGEKVGPTGAAAKKQPKERREYGTADSFTFSKTDEERSYAKDEAQKDFDARVERERSGKDFGSGDQRRWK